MAHQRIGGRPGAEDEAEGGGGGMNPIDAFRKVAFAQVLIGLVTTSVVAGSAMLVMMVGTLAMLAWYVVESPGGRPLPRWFLSLAALTATLWLVVEVFSTDTSAPIIETIGRYISYLILIKLYEEKKNRDWIQILLLSVLQVIGAILRTPDFEFGILVMLYMLAALLAASLFPFKLAHDEVVRQRNRQLGKRVEAVQLNLADVEPDFRNRFLFLTGLFMALTLGITFSMFHYFPRGYGEPILKRWQSNHSMKISGFNTNVQLGKTARELYTSSAPVLNLTVTRNDQVLGPKDLSFIHLRGAVMDLYNPISGMWTNSNLYANTARRPPLREYPKAEETVYRTTLAHSPNAPARDILVLDFKIRARSGRALFTSYPPLVYESPSPAPIRFDPYDMVIEYDSMVESESGLRYTIHALSPELWMSGDPKFGAPEPTMSAERWPNYARIPVIRPSHRDYPEFESAAQNILATIQAHPRDPQAISTPHDHAIAQRLMEYLRDHYTYTLELPSAGGLEPITAFLTRTKAGHCEFFASSMVAILRSIGIRARLVSGFLASEYNQLGGYYIVRDKHAHSWVEAWQDDLGWRTFDPSPPSSVASLHAPSGGLLKPLRELYDMTENNWSEQVTGFDEQQQDSIMAKLSQIKSWALSAFVRGGNWIRLTYRTLGIWGYGITLATFSGVVFLVLYQMHLRIEKTRTVMELQLGSTWDRNNRKLAQHLSFYRTMLQSLRKSGYRKRAWESPAAFAERVQSESQQFGSVLPLTNLFYEIRFGGRPMNDDRAGRVRELMSQLKNGR